eukprot:2937727-Pleurochrysis_carterae.AAC.1
MAARGVHGSTGGARREAEKGGGAVVTKWMAGSSCGCPPLMAYVCAPLPVPDARSAGPGRPVWISSEKRPATSSLSLSQVLSARLPASLRLSPSS